MQRRVHFSTSPHRARGVTLIELMISITIGMLITLLCMSIFMAVTRTSRTHDEASKLDDSGRFALETVTRIARLAGYRNWGGISYTPGGFTSGTTPVVEGTDGAAASLSYSDTLRIRFHGSGTAVGSADGSVVDCLGNAVPEGSATTDWVTNTFTVASDGDALALTCDNGSGAVAIVSGVQSFQVLYGIDGTDGDRVPNVWVSATDVTDWQQVVAVRMSLLMQGNANSRGADLDSNTHRLFDTGYTSTTDLGTTFDASAASSDLRNRLRKVYTTTIFLRNVTYSSPV